MTMTFREHVPFIGHPRRHAKHDSRAVDERQAREWFGSVRRDVDDLPVAEQASGRRPWVVSAPAGPLPAPVPAVKATGEQPVLAEAQRTLGSERPEWARDTVTLRRAAEALRGAHPFDVPGIRTETGRITAEAVAPRPGHGIRPLPPVTPKHAGMPPVAARARINAGAVLYPPVDITSPALGDYSRVMHWLDRITGTSGTGAGAAPRAIGGAQ